MPIQNVFGNVTPYRQPDFVGAFQQGRQFKQNSDMHKENLGFAKNRRILSDKQVGYADADREYTLGLRKQGDEDRQYNIGLREREADMFHLGQMKETIGMGRSPEDVHRIVNDAQTHGQYPITEKRAYEIIHSLEGVTPETFPQWKENFLHSAESYKHKLAKELQTQKQAGEMKQIKAGKEYYINPKTGLPYQRTGAADSDIDPADFTRANNLAYDRYKENYGVFDEDKNFLGIRPGSPPPEETIEAETYRILGKKSPKEKVLEQYLNMSPEQLVKKAIKEKYTDEEWNDLLDKLDVKGGQKLTGAAAHKWDEMHGVLKKTDKSNPPAKDNPENPTKTGFNSGANTLGGDNTTNRDSRYTDQNRRRKALFTKTISFPERQADLERRREEEAKEKAKVRELKKKAAEKRKAATEKRKAARRFQ